MNKSKLSVGALVGAVVLTSGLGMTPASYADNDAAAGFIGGMMAARIGQNMRARTQAEQQQAYYAQQQAQAAQRQQAQPVQQAAPQSQSVEDKLAQLDKLAAGGYITPEEYKAKRQQILDSM